LLKEIVTKLLDGSGVVVLILGQCGCLRGQKGSAIAFSLLVSAFVLLSSLSRKIKQAFKRFINVDRSLCALLLLFLLFLVLLRLLCLVFFLLLELRSFQLSLRLNQHHGTRCCTA
jgi:hypothetical protein